MLKFRLPYAPGITDYLAGDIYMQVWAPPTSTETRLITQSKEIVQYDNTDYESKLFRWNVCTREHQKFDMGIDAELFKHIPNNYDLKGEVEIWSEYLMQIRGKTKEELPRFIRGMFVTLDKFFGKTLIDKYQEAEAKTMARLNFAKEKKTFERQDRKPQHPPYAGPSDFSRREPKKPPPTAAIIPDELTIVEPTEPLVSNDSGKKLKKIDLKKFAMKIPKSNS
jgi:hypothetical protein